MKIQLTFLLLFVFFGTYALRAQEAFLAKADAFLHKHVTDGLIDYEAVTSDPSFEELADLIDETDYTKWTPDQQKAYLINAYNLLTIKGVVDNYPVGSVQDVAGFFDRKRHVVGGKSMTLNELEKDVLLKEYPDPRLHFVLVCGAKGCPPIIPEAYRPETLEAQLERQTRRAMNDPQFIRVNRETGENELSQIFRWYVADFGGSQQAVVDFINRFREKALLPDYRISYYTYDWALNGTMQDIAPGLTANNAARYVVSSTIPKGTTETKIFNNLYTQRTRNNGEDFTDRSTFFTTITSFLYGVSHRMNVGFDARYRAVHNGASNDSPLNALGNAGRTGITTFGPKVRIAPVPQWTNFSIQSAFWFPIGDDLAGRSGEQPFIDWDGATWWTQVFNDFPIGTNFSFFTEVDLLLEDIGREEEGRLNRLSTPVTLIYSYFPNPQTTLYVLGNYSPFWQENYDYFWQAGVGTKYQFTRQLELELSYTYFSNQFLAQNMGRAATYNLGVRFNL